MQWCERYDLLRGDVTFFTWGSTVTALVPVFGLH